VPQWLVWLGRGGRLLAGELTSPLRCLVLDVGLLSVGLSSLPLPKSAMLLEGGGAVSSRDASAHSGTVIMA
jgi:hypothetical protein